VLKIADFVNKYVDRKEGINE
jgi:hypothetical protein